MDRRYYANLLAQLRRPDVAAGDVAGTIEVDPEIFERIEIECKLEGYVRRTTDAIDRSTRAEAVPIPADTSFKLRG